MMKHEFEALAGYEVSEEDYRTIIEPMYMATHLEKSQFVKCIDAKRFKLKSKKQLINKMKIISRHLRATCTHYTDYSAREELDTLFAEYQKRFDPSARIYEDTYMSCYYPDRIVSGTQPNIWLVN